MKNAITLSKARAIQAALAERGHRIDLELLTDRATLPEEGEEPQAVALSPALRYPTGGEISKNDLYKTARELEWTLAVSAGILSHTLLDVTNEAGNNALCNGYAHNGAVDRSANLFLWVFLPLAPETT